MNPAKLLVRFVAASRVLPTLLFLFAMAACKHH
jgi:hypothetical protein